MVLSTHNLIHSHIFFLLCFAVARFESCCANVCLHLNYFILNKLKKKKQNKNIHNFIIDKKQAAVEQWKLETAWIKRRI